MSVLAVDDSGAGGTWTPASAPIRVGLLDANSDGQFTQTDISMILSAGSGGTWGYADLNGNGIPLAGELTTDTEAFDLDGVKVNGTPNIQTILMPFNGARIQYNEASLTDRQILCYYAYSGLYTGTPATREQLLAPSGGCLGTIIGADIQISDSNAAWNMPVLAQLRSLGTPISWNGFWSGTGGSTCAFGEQGGPVFSAQVQVGATFYSVRGVTGPYQVGGILPNRIPCSSFLAYMPVQTPTGTQLKVWMNIALKGERFTQFGSSTNEYQTRYYSGDPANNFAGRSMVVGTSLNEGNFNQALTVSSFGEPLLIFAPR
jgi:hypothetical protein